MNKRWIYLIGVGLCVVIAYIAFNKFLEFKDKREYTIASFDLREDFRFQLSLLNDDFKLIPSKVKFKQETKNYSYSKIQFELKSQQEKVGELLYEEYQIKETGDLYYFIRYRPQRKINDPLHVRATISSKTSEVKERHIIYPPVLKGSPYSIENSKWTKPVALALQGGLPPNSLYLNSNEFSYYVNKIEVYEAMGNGVRKTRQDLIQPMHWQSNDTTKSIDMMIPHENGMEIEQWGVIGKPGLFNWSDEKQDILKLKANFDFIRKWTREGIQYIPDPSYVPYDPSAFWLVPAQHVGNKLLLYGDDRFSSTMAMMSLEAALLTQNKEGYWISTPRSSWLHEDYGIGEGFYDTRFNTDAALFLLEGYRIFQDERYLTAASQYAEFLIDYVEKHHEKTVNGGYLVYDYNHGHMEAPVAKTHVSLNHLLAEMNFLYEIYMDTNDQAYFEAAAKLRLAVQDTTQQWKKDNGDLWYAYMVDGSFGKQDYVHLTLKDLRKSQELINKVENRNDPHIQELIDWKSDFLVKSGYPLYDWEDEVFNQ